MNGIVKVLFLLFLASCVGYNEFKMEEISPAINTVFLRDSLRYLHLTSEPEAVIKNTLSDGKVNNKILTFKKEKIRVLIIYDQKTNQQTVNIVAMENGQDLFRASKKHMKSSNIFTFKVNSHYLKKYQNIREEILRNLNSGILRINTIGTTSVYGTLIAVEASSMQIPVESVVIFGGSRFTSQKIHDELGHTFAGKVVAVVHEDDISYKVHMPMRQAKTMKESFVCNNVDRCNDKIYELDGFSLSEILLHFTNAPQTHTQIYHDSLLNYS